MSRSRRRRATDTFLPSLPPPSSDFEGRTAVAGAGTAADVCPRAAVATSEFGHARGRRKRTKRNARSLNALRSSQRGQRNHSTQSLLLSSAQDGVGRALLSLVKWAHPPGRWDGRTDAAMSRRGAGAASFRSSAAHSFAQFLDLRLRRRPPPPSASPTESFIVHPSPSSLFSLFPCLSRRRGFLRLLSSSPTFSSLTHFRLRLRIPGQSSDTQLERERVSLSQKIRRACLPPPRRTHTLRLSAVSAFCHPESPAAGSPGNCRRASAAPSPKSCRNHARPARRISRWLSHSCCDGGVGYRLRRRDCEGEDEWVGHGQLQ